MMGDFNEVRHKSDHFGSVFNAHGADIFNSFINKAGLEEIQLGGSMYTWCHKSATKMSKFDRFFVSKNLLNTCPNINAITFKRYLSDHRPILLCESSCDYGPVPCRFFHYWIEVNGFDKLVMNSWYDAPSHGNNAILSFMSKLNFLKTRIKEWNADYKRSSNGVADKLKEELLKIDVEIDNGNGNADIVARSKFFHDMLNKKRSQSNIRGVLIDGKWADEPVKVKCEFFHHFSNRFGKPSDDRVEIDVNFPNTLLVYQKADLESIETTEEVKRVVWDCGSDKAPGPDGPISLIGSFCKIIAKVLTNRLVGMLGDNVNEKKKQALIFKVDFEKAYDSVRWDYLDDVLDKFGFGIKWRRWIQNCHRSSRGSILINGSPTEEF
uniref:RNA-directed DNA polymerase, eukaryota n=1 Tax=Tanacetum cinerariifolium TaxID=118510 RepID=A0A6L2LE61_TANCI|nr:RNA-directed DNA polymerase, eukaryota [Tanacetum cinerariifolium]